MMVHNDVIVAKSPVHLADKPEGIQEEKARSKVFRYSRKRMVIKKTSRTEHTFLERFRIRSFVLETM
ncbi:hypothetical protein HanHA300_Chr05g0170181 [Helianthus annuus]|nr:hypothetical protein HanHA300_Chr05g0170181 [Helianthus annuus]KAJ0749737.1 hypothetical protein HanLR1_Chr05g0173641 [Helianthus annuus]